MQTKVNCKLPHHFKPKEALKKLGAFLDKDKKLE